VTFHLDDSKEGRDWIKRGRRATIRHPEVVVSLVGEDGNAFAILGRVQRALKEAGVPHDEIRAFYEEATAGDYDHLLRVVMQTVEVV
jgi:hypothetical protein